MTRSTQIAILALAALAAAAVGVALDPRSPAPAATPAEALSTQPSGQPRTEEPAAGQTVLGSSADLTHQRLEAALPVMNGATPLVRIGERLEANHVPMVLASYEIDVPAQEVMEFYAEHFAAKDWPYNATARRVEEAGFATISATLTDAELQLVVMATPHRANKGTTVVLGLADMGAWERHDDQHLAIGFPTYPGSKPSVITTTDEGARSEIVTFSTPDSAAQVRAFLEDTLGRAGFQRAPPEEGAAVWVFVGPDRQWHVQAIEEAGQTSVLARSVPAARGDDR